MQDHPRSAGRTYGGARGNSQKQSHPDWNLWHPFRNTSDFELSHWMMDSGLTRTAIEDYLQRGLDNKPCTLFNSANGLWTLFENLEFGFGSQGWTLF